MINLKPVIRLSAALTCLGAAFLLLARSGLPSTIELNDNLHEREPGAGLAIGSQAPPFQLMNTFSEQVGIDGSAGRITIVNFWATYCAPCRQEMRELQQLLDNWPDSLRVLAVNLGEPDDAVDDWKRELGISYDLLLDPSLAVAQRYLVRGVPTTYLLDSDQRIRKVYYGPVTGAILNSDIQRLALNA